MYSGSLWRTDAIIFSKLNKSRPLSNKPPALNGLEINKRPGGLIEDLRYASLFAMECDKLLVNDNIRAFYCYKHFDRFRDTATLNFDRFRDTTPLNFDRFPDTATLNFDRFRYTVL